MAKVWTDVFNSVEPGQFSSLTEKTTPASADTLVIEDSAAGSAKKRVQIVNLPGGGGGASQLSELSDVTSATQTAGFVLATTGGDYLGRALVDGDIPSTFVQTDDYANATVGGTIKIAASGGALYITTDGSTAGP